MIKFMHGMQKVIMGLFILIVVAIYLIMLYGSIILHEPGAIFGSVVLTLLLTYILSEMYLEKHE